MVRSMPGAGAPDGATAIPAEAVADTVTSTASPSGITPLEHSGGVSARQEHHIPVCGTGSRINSCSQPQSGFSAPLQTLTGSSDTLRAPIRDCRASTPSDPGPATPIGVQRQEQAEGRGQRQENRQPQEQRQRQGQRQRQRSACRGTDRQHRRRRDAAPAPAPRSPTPDSRLPTHRGARGERRGQTPSPVTASSRGRGAPRTRGRSRRRSSPPPPPGTGARASAARPSTGTCRRPTGARRGRRPPAVPA